MQIFFLAEVAVIFFITLYLLYRYAAKEISIYIKILIFITWFLNFVMIVLVPVDVYYSYGLATADPTVNELTNMNPDSAQGLLKLLWQIIYWTAFAFTWAVLPFLQEYVDSGEFNSQDKLKKSIRNSLVSYAILAVIGGVFLGYLFLSGTVNSSSFVEYLITLSNCFGVFLIIICLGFGLVHVPKRYLQHTNKQVNFKYHQFMLAEVDYQKTNLQIETEDLIKKIHLLSVRKDCDASLRVLLEKVLSQCSDELIHAAKQTLNSGDHAAANEVKDITRPKVVKLNRELKKKILEGRRAENKFDTTLRAALHAEDVLLCESPEQWATRSNTEATPPSGCAKCTNFLSYAWYTKIQQVFFFIFGFAFAILSLVVFIAQIVTFESFRIFDISYLMREGDSFLQSQLMCLIPLFYISLCVYSSLFSMNFFGVYGLYKNHHTDAGSLVFASVNFSRVSAPLVFNFFQMLNVQRTAFNQVMGEPRFAQNFTQYFPLVLILLILFNIFDIYGRILTALGLSRFKFSENFNDERIEEGKTILARARRTNSTTSNQGGVFGRGSKKSHEATDFTLNAKLLSRPIDTADTEDNRSRASDASSPDRLIESTKKDKWSIWQL